MADVEVVIVKDKGGGGVGVGSSKEDVLIRNPLMIEDILEKIFPYFDDPKNLTSFRLVNSTWNKAVCRTIKKNLRWQLGPTARRSEAKFLPLFFSTCKDDLFRNFTITQFRKKSPTAKNRNQAKLMQEQAQNAKEFLAKYGTHIVDLQLRSCHSNFIKLYLGEPELLPKLEYVEFYDLTDSVLADASLFAQITPASFPKLKNIIFNPKINLHDEDEHVIESDASIVHNLLATTSACTELELNLQNTCTTVLAGSGPKPINFLSGLTSFITDNSLDNGGALPPCVILKSTDLRNLVVACPKLKILSTCFDKRTPEGELYEALSHYANTLQELHLVLAEDERGEEADRRNGINNDREEGGEAEDELGPPLDPEQETEAINEFLKVKNPAPHEEYLINYLKRKSAEIAKEEAKQRRAAAGLGPGTSFLSFLLPKSIVNAVAAPAPPPPPETSKKPRQVAFPHLIQLKKLTLRDWKLYNNFGIFENLPALTHLNLTLQWSSCPSVLPSTGHPTLKYFKYRTTLGDGIDAKTVREFATSFPALDEFDIVVANDGALRVLFEVMPRLKRLHLNDSGITDSGMTGIKVGKLGKAAKNGTANKLAIAKLREFPFIGDLKDLQHLTYHGHALTNFIMDFGIIFCGNLTYLKMSPHRTHKRKSLFRLEYTAHRVHVRPLGLHCPHLVKLDVNDAPGPDEDNLDDEDKDWTERDSDAEEDPAHAPIYNGCGMIDDDVVYLQATLPSLEIVYRELWSSNSGSKYGGNGNDDDEDDVSD